MKQKLNMTVGRFQPFTQGHLNMVNEGEAPCIVYRINSSDKVPDTLKGFKVAGRVIKKDSVQIVADYINKPEGDLTEQQKELLKRPFTNELIDKELEIVKRNCDKIIEVVPVLNAYQAFAMFNKFILDHQDEYEPNYWMCGDDRVDNFTTIIDSDDEVAIERGGQKYQNVCKGKLKTNIGMGRTEGVSGTAVRKSILNNDKAAFSRIMPKGVDSMFEDFVNAFHEFKGKLLNLIKESHMSLKEYIIQESLKDKIKSLINKFKKEKVPEKVYKEEDLLEYKDKEITLEDGDEIFNIYINTLDYKSSRTSEFEKNAFKQGLFDYAWCNYSRDVDNKFRFNEFGDDFADKGYSRANDESGYNWDEIGVGMSFMEPFFWGWKCAKKLNLKYNSTTNVKLPLNKFAHKN